MNSTDWHELASNNNLAVFNIINGKKEALLGDDKIDKYAPRDGRLLYSITSGDNSIVDSAVASAREAFNDGRWSGLSVYDRRKTLVKLASLIETYKDQFALYECLDVGKPIECALQADVRSAQIALRNSAELAERVLSSTGFDGGELVYQHRKPVGVVGAITGWNFPLMLAAQKVGPALAMGNCLVLKPSEFTSLSTCLLAELALEAGVPPGVFNVVNGGPAVGASLAKHNDVDLLSFVGSSATGKKIMASAGQSNMKRLILECGGKSPYLVFDDCPDDLDFIADDIVNKAFYNQGAVCIASTRLLLQDGIKEKLLPKIMERAKRLVPQDPLDSSTTFGAIMNEAHMNKVLNYIDSGTAEGAQLILGGQRLEVVPGGYYIGPTIFDQVNPKQRIAQEEIFGPVLSVFSFTEEQQAIQLANDSCFGLAAYAATQNAGRARRLGQSLNAGRIKVLSTSTPSYGDIDMSAEPHRQSGMGFAFGLEGLAAYTVSSNVHVLT